MRTILALAVPCLAIALAVAWTLATPSPLAARFAQSDCRHVALADAATGRAIAGAEDIALAPDGDTLILSAHDRLRDKAQGGLYALSLWGLGGATSDAGAPARARPLLPAPQGVFRPHGIALSPDGARLAVINRTAPGEAVVEIGPLGPEGWRPDRRMTDRRLCRANDIDFVTAGPGSNTLPDTLRVTLDRADCTTSLRDLAGGTGAVALIRDGALSIERAGLNFPNGIAGGWIAETRGRRLLGPDGSAGPIALPGGPDNLSMAGGRVIAALHPNLARTGLYIRGWLGRLSSRIVAVDPATGAVEVFYDDPEGAQFSGATAAVLAGGRLVAGSVRAAGLLYCETPGEPQG